MTARREDPGRRRGWRGWSGALLALLYLNLALTFQNLWPTPWPRFEAVVSIELMALLAGLALWRLAGRRLGLLAAAVLGLILLLAMLLRYAEVSAPPLFGRGLNFYWDIRHLPNLLELVWRSLPAVNLGLIALGLLLLLLLLWGLNALALLLIDRALAARGPRLAGLLLPALAGCLFAGFLVSGAEPLRQIFGVPVTNMAIHHARLIAEALRLRGAGEAEQAAMFGAPLAESPALGTPGSPLAGRDVIVVFIESYGTALFDNPDYARAIAGPFADFERRLDAAGWRAASRRLVSPTFGGGSWLAHASLLGGAMLTDQGRYNLFLSTGRPTLVRRFDDAGYRSVAVMPGTQRQWPEGDWFGYDRIYDAAALAYPGPDFGFWRIPDQYTLSHFETLELDPSPRDPVFALVVLIMTHMPFLPLPPQVADWQGLEDGTAYDPAATAALVAEPVDWDSLGPRYVESMARTFDSLAAFLESHVPVDSLVVIAGDHQPPALVSGEGQPWTSPVHVLSRDDRLLEGFLGRGYTAGLRPPPEGAAPMASFPRDFLAAVAPRRPSG